MNEINIEPNHLFWLSERYGVYAREWTEVNLDVRPEAWPNAPFAANLEQPEPETLEHLLVLDEFGGLIARVRNGYSISEEIDALPDEADRRAAKYVLSIERKIIGKL